MRSVTVARENPDPSVLYASVCVIRLFLVSLSPQTELAWPGQRKLGTAGCLPDTGLGARSFCASSAPARPGMKGGAGSLGGVQVTVPCPVFSLNFASFIFTTRAAPVSLSLAFLTWWLTVSLTVTHFGDERPGTRLHRPSLWSWE